MDKDYYSLLNVNKASSQQDIKKKFMQLSYQLHPDKSSQECTEEFASLSEAYKVLSDPVLSVIYQHYGKQGLRMYEMNPEVYQSQSEHISKARTDYELIQARKVIRSPRKYSRKPMSCTHAIAKISSVLW